MDVKSGARATLCLSGFPNPSEWQRGVLEEVWPLDAEWSLKLGPVTTDVSDGARWRRWGLEHLFRTLDRLLFGGSLRRVGELDILSRLDAAAAEPGSLQLAYCAKSAAQEAALRDEPVLYVEYEGLQLSDLEEAVRQRLGVLDATLSAQVWMIDPARQKRLLFQGQLDLDHRSLSVSVAQCAAKLPALLRAAVARMGQPAALAPQPARPAGKPLPAHRMLLRMMQAVVRRLLWRGQWQIETYQSDGQATASGTLSSWFKPPSSLFWADPFIVSMQDRTWLLFEELPYATNKGHISAIELDQEGRPKSRPQVVLDESRHLAYPFMFEHEGKRYMMPDASVGDELVLYTCGDDPLHWQRSVTLMSEKRIADATIASYQGRLWMFACHGDDGASMDDTLHIYWAEQPTGPWHPHKLNPVKIDARSSRPAGAMWMEGGVLHRVVQDCSRTYGGATACTRVLVLNEQEFAEEVMPGWAGNAASPSVPWHTFNRHANLFATDRLRSIPRWTSG